MQTQTPVPETSVESTTTDIGLKPMPYPSSPLARAAAKAPMLWYRMGLAPLVGRVFMVLTTTGRKSGQVRHTPLKLHMVHGRKFVMAAWPESDWYRNLLADPRVTIQTAYGTEFVRARRVLDDAELRDLHGHIEASPAFREFAHALGFNLTLEEFLAHKAAFHIVTFDPTDEVTPEPLDEDLKWVPRVILTMIVLRLIRRLARGARRQRMS